jgi:hypothetical protein
MLEKMRDMGRKVPTTKRIVFNTYPTSIVDDRGDLEGESNSILSDFPIRTRERGSLQGFGEVQGRLSLLVLSLYWLPFWLPES